VKSSLFVTGFLLPLYIMLTTGRGQHVCAAEFVCRNSFMFCMWWSVNVLLDHIQVVSLACVTFSLSTGVV